MSGWSIHDKSPQFIEDLNEAYRRKQPFRELPPQQVWEARCHFYGRIISASNPPSRVLVVQPFCWQWSEPQTKLYFVPLHTINEGEEADQRRRHTVDRKGGHYRSAINRLDWPDFERLFPEPQLRILQPKLQLIA